MNINDLSYRDKFILSRWMYAIGNPIISDPEYTFLLEYMQKTYPDDVYLKRSWSSDPCPDELLTRVGLSNHQQNIVLAERTESIPSINTHSDLVSELGNITYGTLSMKHDGWNMQAFYQDHKLVAVRSRGRISDSMNADVLRTKVPNTIPASGNVRIVHEATVNKRNFLTCKLKWNSASPRSAVSTILANPDNLDLLDLHAFAIHGYEHGALEKFKILEEWGFDVPMNLDCHDFNSLMEGFRQLSDSKESYQSPTDGVVFDGNCVRAIRLLAWEEPIIKSYIRDYAESYNIHRISPKLVIRPVARGGAIQRVIPMTNWQRIIDNDLRPGSPVAFRIASSAIADFDANATKMLQEEWRDRYDEYRQLIDFEEESRERTVII